MSITDEIRARVKKADEARITSRAERAATVATVHLRRAELLTQLTEVETELETSVRSAMQVMTVDELVEFAGVPRADVRGKVPPRATAVKARSPKTRRQRTPQPSSGDGVPSADPAA